LTPWSPPLANPPLVPSRRFPSPKEFSFLAAPTLIYPGVFYLLFTSLLWLSSPFPFFVVQSGPWLSFDAFKLETMPLPPPFLWGKKPPMSFCFRRVAILFTVFFSPYRSDAPPPRTIFQSCMRPGPTELSPFGARSAPRLPCRKDTALPGRARKSSPPAGWIEVHALCVLLFWFIRAPSMTPHRPRPKVFSLPGTDR